MAEILKGTIDPQELLNAILQLSKNSNGNGSAVIKMGNELISLNIQKIPDTLEMEKKDDKINPLTENSNTELLNDINKEKSILNINNNELSKSKINEDIMSQKCKLIIK